MSELSPENRALIERLGPFEATDFAKFPLLAGRLETLLNAARLEGSQEATREFVAALKPHTSEGGA